MNDNSNNNTNDNNNNGNTGLSAETLALLTRRRGGQCYNVNSYTIYISINTYISSIQFVYICLYEISFPLANIYNYIPLLV